MQFDTYDYILMEHTDFPGNIGDSCAETSRYQVLMFLLGHTKVIDLSNFVTDKGVLRHPDSPWREDDTSGDQVSPLLAACSLYQPELAAKVCKHIIDAGYRTGNGDLISPGLLAILKRHNNSKFQWFYDLSLLGQALIMKLPIRWSDSKRRLELSVDSSADYLNLFNSLAFALCKGNLTWPYKLVLQLVSKEVMLEKIEHYYKPEPNCQWLLNSYKEGISILWDRK